MPRFERLPHFRRRYQKLSDEERRACDRALRLLATDPHDLRLRTHKLTGERWACSYAYDGRIVFLWAGELIILLDLGSHDEVY